MASWYSRGRYLPLSAQDSRYHKSFWSFTRLARNGPAAFALIAVAVVSAIFTAFGLLSFGHRPQSISCASPLSSDTSYENPVIPPPAHTTKPVVFESNNDELSLEALRHMVAHTRGYYARDYSMGLGWNNMRYIIETALLHGQILNRTVITPSFVYARSCEFDISVCAAYAPMVNRGDAINSDEWRQLPDDQQMSWRIPTTIMFNFTHVRKTQAVMTVSDYLRLHNVSEDAETSDGRWDTSVYHQNANVFETNKDKKPSLHVIENWWYDPSNINRVDAIPEDMKLRGQWNNDAGDRGQGQVGGWKNIDKSPLYLALEAALPEDRLVLDWSSARSIVQRNGHTWDVTTDEGTENALRENGWEVLYTYEGALGMEYVKNVVNPIRQVVPRQSIRGVQEDYGDLNEDVVLLRGEIHYQRKPGSLRFTTPEGRDGFSRLVLYEMRAIDKVLELATLLGDRMTELNGGRMWMGAHMRRGDFVRVNWAMESEFGAHFERIQKRLDDGRRVLRSLHDSSLIPYAIPEATIDQSILQQSPPEDGDKFYIATDERDPGNVAYMKDHGVVLVSDLLTIEDRRNFGWPLMMTDVLGVVEQATLARGAYFYAHALSSVAGGVVNIRAARGADPRTAKID